MPIREWVLSILIDQWHRPFLALCLEKMKRILPNADPESSIPQSAQPKVRENVTIVSLSMYSFCLLACILFVSFAVCPVERKCFSAVCMSSCLLIYLRVCSLFSSAVKTGKKRCLNSSIRSMEKGISFKMWSPNLITIALPISFCGGFWTCLVHRLL